MNEVGELIQETIEAVEVGALETAFAKASAAVTATLVKSKESEDLVSGDYQNFVKRHWQLLAFIGLPRALPLPLAVEFGLSRIVHGFNLKTAEEMVSHLVRQAAASGRTPAQFRFYHGNVIEMRGDQIFVPVALISALVSVVIFQPVNRDQSVPDKYWLNVSDFKMFISEFWGRIDLAERIMNFYAN